jgi:threonine/homoserine/homoserine lactone efflux protein
MLLALGAFSVAAVLIVLLPGPDTLVVVRALVRGGRRRGISTTLGVLSGLTVWAGAAALGLSALLTASTVGYEALRIAGGAYLVWLGVSSLRHRGGAVETAPERPHLLGSGFGAGLLTDLLNPKVGVFFVTFLPGFLPRGYPVAASSLLFGAIFVALTALYFAALLTLAARVTGWMSTPSIRRRLDAVTGTVLVGLGIRLAVET